ncbi:hypothetical protein [Pseudomonas sp. 24 E 13]|nr:hypothetical protein [Pseudomonas sp. 24 E 13]
MAQRTRRPLHLAAGGFRQRARIEQHHHARRLLAGLGHCLANRLDQCFGRQDFLHAAADFRSNADAFHAVVIYRKGGHSALAYYLHLTLDGLLDVLRVQIVSAYDQQVFQAPGDVHLTVTDKPQVAGAQPGPADVLDESPRAGFGVAPVTVGNARAAGPEFAHAIVGQRAERVGIGNQHGVVRLMGAATHDRTTLPRLGAVGGQRLRIQVQRRDAVATAATGDKQGRFGQAIGGEEIIRAETAGGEFFAEPFQGVQADRLGTGIGHAPGAQVQAFQGRLADPLAAQTVGEVRATADGAAVFADRLEPAQRPRQEVGRRHQHARHTAENRLQQAADQAHVVVQRQPADDHIVRVEVDAKAAADQHFIGHQVAVTDLHALGQRGGSGGVLQEGDVVGLQLGGEPTVGKLWVEGVHAQQRRCVFDLRQAISEAGDGQQPARLGIADDRQQAFLMMALARFRRVSRHRNHPGVQATKERRDIVRAAGKQQHRALAHRDIGLQGGGDGARALVQVTVAEHHAVLGGLGQKAQGQAVRGLRGTALEGLDQSAGKFEGVHHGVPA